MKKAFFNKKGVIIVKENVKNDRFLVFRRENTIIRPETLYKKIFELSNLRILHEFLQENLPEVHKKSIKFIFFLVI